MMESETKPTMPRLVIRPPNRWAPLNIREILDYRELVFFFTWRDIKLRYKQTALGGLWALIQPLFTMIVFTLFFGNLAKMPSDGIPYPLFSLAALLPWMLFSEGITRSTLSMINNSNIMTKVYYPRIIMPLASILSPLVDFCVSVLLLIAMMLLYGFMPSVNVVWVVPFILLAMATSLGVGLWLSALNVEYRDFQYTIPFLIQLWMFASPVVYSSTLLPEPYRVLYGLNPMVGVIDGFRWALLGTAAPGQSMLISVGVALVLLVTGAIYFRRMEQYYADVV